MTHSYQWDPGEIVGGHRLLRRLGYGGSAEVWLAAPAAAEDGERVALKLFRSDTAAGRATREAEALWRARGPHVVRLLDVVPVADGTPLLLLDAVPHELHTVLAARLAPGAAVTVLIPIAQTIARLHARGVTHGGVRVSAIGLDRHGSPVLLGFGNAVSGAASTERRAADCAAFAALALVVLASVEEPERDAGWRRLVAWIGASQSDAADWLAACVDRCYDYAAPQPVALASAESHSAVLLPSVAPDRAPARSTVSGASDLLGRMRELASWRPAFLRNRVVPRSDDDAAPASGVRARFWVPAAVAGAGLLVVLLVPMGGSADAAVLPQLDDAASVTPTASPESVRTPTSSPTASPEPVQVPSHATVLNELGGAFIVEVDGPRGPEQLVLVAGPDGWEVREHLAVDPDVREGQAPSTPAKSPPSSRDFTAPRKRAASAPSMIR